MQMPFDLAVVDFQKAANFQWFWQNCLFGDMIYVLCKDGFVFVLLQGWLME